MADRVKIFFDSDGFRRLLWNSRSKLRGIIKLKW